jgi:hypothetical protein
VKGTRAKEKNMSGKPSVPRQRQRQIGQPVLAALNSLRKMDQGYASKAGEDFLLDGFPLAMQGTGSLVLADLEPEQTLAIDAGAFRRQDNATASPCSSPEESWPDRPTARPGSVRSHG